MGAIVAVAVAVVIAAAVIAAAPAIAGAVTTTALAYGVSSTATAMLATTVNIGCAGLAACISATGANRAIETITGTNWGARILGEENYTAFESVVNFAAMAVVSAPLTTPYPSTGRSKPQNLYEQIGMKLARKYPGAGKVIVSSLGDSRMPGWLGWQKYQQFFEGTGVEIHYVGNRFIPIYFDFKFK